MVNSQSNLVASSSLIDFACKLLEAAGLDDEEATIVAESLVESNLCGHDSHGVIQIPGYVRQMREGELVAGAELVILNETAAAIVADGCFGYGPVQCYRIIEKLVPKAREQGIACATVRNCGHVGRLGAWVERLAEHGLAAMMTVTDNGVLRCVAPPDGITPCVSTNPLAVSVPTGDEPLTLDISTSAVANGKIRLAHFAGKECPPGWLQDAEGNPTTNPAVRFTDPRGTILPMGGEQGYKGFGLSIMLDILASGLSGGVCPPAGPPHKMTNNVLLVAWNPTIFAGASHFVTEADKLIDSVRNSQPKPGVERVRLPGDRLRGTFQSRTENGIPLDAGTARALIDLARELEVALPSWLTKQQ